MTDPDAYECCASASEAREYDCAPCIVIWRLREERDALEAAAKPFAAVAEGIPDNWPEECALTWVDDEGRSQIRTYLTYFSRAWLTGTQPKIRDYRRLRALIAPKEDARG